MSDVATRACDGMGAGAGARIRRIATRRSDDVRATADHGVPPSLTALLAASFVSAFALSFCWRMGLGWDVNADEVTNFFIADDLLHGNLLLRGWYFSTGLFLLPGLEVAVLSHLLGYQDMAFYLASSINWALLIMACELAAWYACHRSGVRFGLRQALVLELVIVVPCHAFMLNSGTHVLCVAVAILSLCMLIWMAGLPLRRCIWWYVPVVFIGGLLGATNTMFAYTMMLPAIAAAGVLFLLRRRDLQACLRLALPAVAVYATQSVLKTLWASCDGVYLAFQKHEFIAADQLLSSINSGIVGVLRLFGVNMWGKEPFGPATVGAALGCAVLAKLILELVRYLRRVQEGGGELVICLLMVAGINLSAYTFSTFAMRELAHTHVLFPTLMGLGTAGVAAWTINASRDGARQPSVTVAPYVALSFLAMCPPLSLAIPHNAAADLASALVESGVRSGFGGPCSTSLAAYYALHNGVRLTLGPTVAGAAGRLVGHEWLVREDDLWTEGTCFVVKLHGGGDRTVRNTDVWDISDEVRYPVDEDEIQATFGPWYQSFDVGDDFRVYLWDRPVSLGGFSGTATYLPQMGTSSAEMRLASGEILIRPSEEMFGPHVDLVTGMYDLVVELGCSGPVRARITADNRERTIRELELRDGRNDVVLPVLLCQERVELIIEGNEAAGDILVRDVRLSRRRRDTSR